MAGKAGIGDVVAEIIALLQLAPGRILAAEQDHPLIVIGGQIRVERGRIEFVIQIAGVEFIEDRVVVIGPFELVGVDEVDLVFGVIISGIAAEALNVRFLAAAERHIERVIVVGRQGQLAEIEVAAEGADEGAFEVADVAAGKAFELRDRSGITGGADVEGAILIIAFIGGEEEELVLDDRAAERRAILLALERRLGIAVALVDEAFFGQRLVGILAENLAMEIIGARFGDGGDDRGAGLFIFGLVVLRNDAEFLDGELAEGIATAVLLPRHAAFAQLVLEADAIDEDIDLAGRRGARREALVGFRVIVAHPRRERGEAQEVAIRLRQDAQLLLADVGRDFAGAGFAQAAAGDDDLTALPVIGRRRGGAGRGFGGAAELRVDRGGGADADGDVLLEGALGRIRHGNTVSAGAHAVQNIGTAGIGGGRLRAAGAGAGQRHRSPGDRRTRTVGHPAADRRDRGLGHGRYGDRQAGQRCGADKQQADCGHLAHCIFPFFRPRSPEGTFVTQLKADCWCG